MAKSNGRHWQPNSTLLEVPERMAKSGSDIGEILGNSFYLCIQRANILPYVITGKILNRNTLHLEKPIDKQAMELLP